MKTSKFYAYALTFLLSSAFMVSCSDDDKNELDPTKGNETEKIVEKKHFDIWVSLGGTSGMGKSKTQLVMNVNSLEEQEKAIDFKGVAADVTAMLNQESIINGKYYYQVPKNTGRIGKYQISNKKATTIKEIAFSKNTFLDRRYSHAWIDDTTFVIAAASGDKKQVIWTKINAENLTITAEGTLNLPALPEGGKFSTSGLLSYRKADKKLIYLYTDKNKKAAKQFFYAFINPATMEVEKTGLENRAEEMAGTAYGELLQHKTFFDDKGNFYLACSSQLQDAAPSVSTDKDRKSTEKYGSLLRIKKGESSFDKTYVGFSKGENDRKGKIVTVDYLGNDEALLYIQDPEYTKAPGWGANYNCYYAVLDLKTDKLEVLDLPFSEGTFSQRSLVEGDKAYIGVNPEKTAPCVYIYDIKSKKLTKGLSITEGYSFDRIVSITE